MCVCRGYLSEVHCLAMFEVLSSNTAIERPKMVQVLVLGAIPKAVGLVVEVGVERRFTRHGTSFALTQVGRIHLRSASILCLASAMHEHRT